MKKHILLAGCIAGLLSTTAFADNCPTTDQIIQQIQSAKKGDVVTIPACTYTFGDKQTIHLKHNGVTIQAQGAVFQKQSGASRDNLFYIGGNNNKIIGLTIDGNRPNPTSKGGSGIVVKGKGNQLSNLTISNNMGHGVLFSGKNGHCGNNSISDSNIFNNTQVGIAQSACSGNTIQSNHTHGNGNEGITVDTGSNNAKIIGNVVEDNCHVGGVGGIGLDNTQGTLVQGNTVRGNVNGCGGIKFQNNEGSSSNNRVIDNKVGNNAGRGIWLYNNNGKTTNNTVVSNNCAMNGVANDAGGQGNQVSQNTDVCNF